MNTAQFLAARDTLDWSYDRLAVTLGASKRQLFRYAKGKPVPEDRARLLRLLVILRLTVSDRKFAQVLSELEGR